MPIITGEYPSTWRGSESRPQNDFSFLRGGGVSGGGNRGDLEAKIGAVNKANTKAPLPDDEPDGGVSGVSYTNTKNVAHQDPNTVLDSNATLPLTFWNAPVLDVDAVLKDIQLQNNIQATQVNTSTLNGISATVLSFIDGATSNIQAQIDAKSTSVLSLTAGETISGATTPVAVYSVKTQETTTIENSIDVASASATTLTTTTWGAQTFTTGANVTYIKGVYIRLNGVTLTGTTNVKLYATDSGTGKPTGAALATATLNSTTMLIDTYTYWFDFNYSCSANTLYAVVVNQTTSGSFQWDSCSAGSITSTGQGWSSADSGATWVSTTFDFMLVIKAGTEKTLGRVYSCDGNDVYKLGFIGFAITTGNAGDSITVQTDGVVSGFTGLTAGRKYYVNDSGTLSTTKGTYRCLVGTAMSTTTILIEKNRESIYVESYITPNSDLSVISTFTTQHIYTLDTAISAYFWISGNGQSGSNTAGLRSVGSSLSPSLDTSGAGDSLSFNVTISLNLNMGYQIAATNGGGLPDRRILGYTIDPYWGG